LATHSGVLCGVAVETATLSCWNFEDWAKEEPDIASAKRIPKNPMSIDLLFMVAPPRSSVHAEVADSIPADGSGEFPHIIANGFGICLWLPTVIPAVGKGAIRPRKAALIIALT
jgi:hypothetical protein